MPDRRTPHERAMERLAERITALNQMDARLTATDSRNQGGKKDGDRR